MMTGAAVREATVTAAARDTAMGRAVGVAGTPVGMLLMLMGGRRMVMGNTAPRRSDESRRI